MAKTRPESRCQADYECPSEAAVDRCEGQGPRRRPPAAVNRSMNFMTPVVRVPVLSLQGCRCFRGSESPKLFDDDLSRAMRSAPCVTHRRDHWQKLGVSQLPTPPRRAASQRVVPDYDASQHDESTRATVARRSQAETVAGPLSNSVSGARLLSRMAISRTRSWTCSVTIAVAVPLQLTYRARSDRQLSCRRAAIAGEHDSWTARSRASTNAHRRERGRPAASRMHHRNDVAKGSSCHRPSRQTVAAGATEARTDRRPAASERTAKIDAHAHQDDRDDDPASTSCPSHPATALAASRMRPGVGESRPNSTRAEGTRGGWLVVAELGKAMHASTVVNPRAASAPTFTTSSQRQSPAR